MKEYLFKYNDQYTLVELSKEDAESNPEQYIKIPDGAEKYIQGVKYPTRFGFVKGDKFWDGEWVDHVDLAHEYNVVWQRESINDKIATAEVARQESKSIDATLAERQSQYGSFTGVANTTGQLMAIIKNSPNGHTMPYAHEEALHMICSKIARIVNGDINSFDGWHDIAGYATLIQNIIGENDV